MAGLQLKSDNTILRYPDRDARNEPVDPLTPEEKQFLIDNCWIRCRNAYKNRMSRGFLSDWEDAKDLDGEAWIFMHNILSKFDKKVYEGRILPLDADDYEEGPDKPKPLKFYFLNYIYGRVNFVACEARDFKKKRGIGPKGAVDEVSYDDEQEDSFGLYNHKYEATGEIFLLLNAKSPEFQRFFKQQMMLQMSQKELREEWGIYFNKLKQELTKFKSEIKKKHRLTYLSQIKFKGLSTKDESIVADEGADIDEKESDNSDADELDDDTDTALDD